MRLKLDMDCFVHHDMDPEVLRRLDALQAHLIQLTRNTEAIMATQAQMQAALDAQTTAIETVSADVSVVAAEVVDLIAKLGTAGIPDAMVAQAQGVADKLSAIDAALKAIPGQPA